MNWRTHAYAFGIPPRLIVPRSALRSTPALERVQRYITEDFRRGRCLVLAGPTGVGKSLAAVHCIRSTSDGHTHSDERRFFYFPALCGHLLRPERRDEALERVKRTHF